MKLRFLLLALCVALFAFSAATAKSVAQVGSAITFLTTIVIK